MAAVAHPLFLYDNLIDDAVLTASSAATPVERVREMRPRRVWTAAGCADEWVRAAWSEPQELTHLAVINHNLDAAGDIAVAGTVEGAATWTQAREAWDPVSGLGDDRFGLSLGGYPLLSDFADYRAYKLFDLGGRVEADTVTFGFANPLNADGQVSVGRLFAGAGYQPSRGMAYGWELEWEDPSEQIETEETVLVRVRRKRRVLRLSFNHLPRAEALSEMDDLKRIVGRSRDLVVVLFPLIAEPEAYRTTIHGIPTIQGATANPHFDRHSTSLTIREL